MQVTIKVEPRQLNRLCYVRLHTYECSHPFDFIPAFYTCVLFQISRGLSQAELGSVGVYRSSKQALRGVKRDGKVFVSCHKRSEGGGILIRNMVGEAKCQSLQYESSIH